MNDQNQKNFRCWKTEINAEVVKMCSAGQAATVEEELDLMFQVDDLRNDQ